MFYHEDWLLRQIEMMITAILNIVFKHVAQEQKEENFIVQQKLQELLCQNKICEAENFIFEMLESKKNDYGFFAVVMDFYKQVNSMSESDLNAFNFSHEEVKDGIMNFCSHFSADKEISRLLDEFSLDEIVEKENEAEEQLDL